MYAQCAQYTVAGTLYAELTYRDPPSCLQRTPSVHANALFGTDLESVVRRGGDGPPRGTTGPAGVPGLVRRCVEEVERRGGLEAEGVYRVRGAVGAVRRLRDELEMEGWRFCPSCQLLTPPRSYHCKVRVA